MRFGNRRSISLEYPSTSYSETAVYDGIVSCTIFSPQAYPGTNLRLTGGINGYLYTDTFGQDTQSISMVVFEGETWDVVYYGEEPGYYGFCNWIPLIPT